MANPDRGEIAWVVNGKEYTLRPRTNAIRALEQRTKKTYGQILRSVDDFDAEIVCQFMLALLQPYHAKEIRSVEQVGDLIDDAGGMQKAVRLIVEMLVLNNQKATTVAEGGAENPPSAQAGTGEPSGSAPVASA